MEQKPIAIAPKRDLATYDEFPSEPAKDGEDPSMPYTCLTCARRKVKCDKASPTCSTCRKARLDCTYQEPAPRKRKRKPVDDVQERLELYEQILKTNGLLPNAEGDQNQNAGEAQWPLTLASLDTEKPVVHKTGKLIGKQDKTRYIGPTLMRTLAVDLEPSSDEEDQENEEASPYGLSQIRGPDALSAAFQSPSASSVSLLNFHPTYENAMRMWRIYVDNVDPVVKVAHVPTLEKILQRAAAQPSCVPKATEALLFAVYHFAVISSLEEDIIQILGEERNILLARYEGAVRQALVNAQWLKSTNIAVIQAYMLFLLSVRSTYDPQTFWILTGTATSTLLASSILT